MRLLSSASIFVITELKDPRHCSTTGCPARDWKNDLVLGTEFNLCVAFLHFVPTLVSAVQGLFCTGRILMLTSESILPCSKSEEHSSQSVLFPYSAKGPEPHLILSPNPKITGHLLSTLFQLLFLMFL